MRTTSRTVTISLVVAGTALLLGGPARGAGHEAAEKESKEEKIARALRAAPESVGKHATVKDVDGAVLREGKNGWTCYPGMKPGDHHPVCNDAVWDRLLAAVGDKAPFETDRVGISYMFEGDFNVSNEDPYSTDPNDGTAWVEEGPHLMIVVPDKSALEGLSTDPNNGGPYVMWKNTPYAHIMVPLGPRKVK